MSSHDRRKGAGDSWPDFSERTAKLVPRRRGRSDASLPVLRVTAGRDLASFVELRGQERVTIGRDAGADLQLHDPSVSRLHAVLRPLGSEEYLVEDQDSLNGIAVDGHRLRVGVLRPGSRLEVGGVLLRLDLLSEEELAHYRRVRDQLLRAEDRDPLTGCHTRAFLDEEAPALLDEARASGLPLSCVFADIDHFKSVNDRFGHAAGDAVLQATAHLLLLDCRRSDRCVRYGGEEFLLLLPRTPLEGAVDFARRLRRVVAGHEWEHVHPGLRRVTLSLGVAEAAPGELLPALIDRADRAMYRAKRGGRNRVVVAEPPELSPPATGRGGP